MHGIYMCELRAHVREQVYVERGVSRRKCVQLVCVLYACKWLQEQCFSQISIRDFLKVIPIHVGYNYCFFASWTSVGCLKRVIIQEQLYMHNSFAFQVPFINGGTNYNEKFIEFCYIHTFLLRQHWYFMPFDLHENIISVVCSYKNTCIND